MLSDQFAQKHRLCEFGMSQLNMNTNRPVREMWFDRDMPTCGTILMWIASRAQYEKQALIRCTAECVRETTAWCSAAADQANDAIQTVLGWCDGTRTRDDVERVTLEAISRAKAAGKQAGGQVEKQLWAAISSLSRCVRSVSCCSGAISAAVKVAEAAGESAEAWQQRFADKIRSMLPWDEVESAIAADKTSPRPRQKSPEEVAAETKRIVDEFEALLANLKSAQEQKQQVFAAAGTSPERMREFLSPGRLGPRNEAVLAEKLAELDAEDSAAQTAKPGAAPPRRQRMIV